ncbi:hypothetical protein FSP39_009962 [Pinctada imbricata]|uniref:Uncharacterized protein n=1 Tax=Pinctada imbricata TaxID=66713 RepID=A0AA89CAC8_PINIB|nr:hypothetical protein FSP39_009962 [Pinctada imbricata]
MIHSFNANNKRNLSSSSPNSSDIQQASKKANNALSDNSSMSSVSERSGTGSDPVALLAQLGLIQRPPSKSDSGPQPNVNIPNLPLTSTPVPTGPSKFQGSPDAIPRLSDEDVVRIAVAVKALMNHDLESMIQDKLDPLIECCTQLANENKVLLNKIDELEMYSRRNCIRVFGVPETESDTDKVVLDIAKELDVPLSPNELAVSHRVGRPNASNNAKPRAIIARITKHNLRHQLLKQSKNLPKIPERNGVYINQDLTKTRNKLAYEVRQLVKLGKAKSSFVWDGKIFLVDHNEYKHLITCLDDLISAKKKILPQMNQPDQALYGMMAQGNSK